MTYTEPLVFLATFAGMTLVVGWLSHRLLSWLVARQVAGLGEIVNSGGRRSTVVGTTWTTVAAFSVVALLAVALAYLPMFAKRAEVSRAGGVAPPRPSPEKAIEPIRAPAEVGFKRPRALD